MTKNKIDDVLSELRDSVDRREKLMHGEEPVEAESEDTRPPSLFLALLSILAIALFCGFVVSAVWNFSLSQMFDWPTMSFLQGAALYGAFQLIRLTGPRS